MKKAVQSLDSTIYSISQNCYTGKSPPGDFLSGKISALLDILIMHPKEKVIIFSMIKDSLVYLYDYLRRYRDEVYLYKGDRWKKEETVNKFLNSDNGVLFADDSASKGRNLQKAHILINFDVPWNPSDLEQRMGRVSRIGQKKEIYIYNLVPENSIQELILNFYTHKLNMFKLVVGELSSMLSEKEEVDFEKEFLNIISDFNGFQEIKQKFEETGREYLKTRQNFENGFTKGSSGIDEILFGDDSSDNNLEVDAEIQTVYYG